MKRKWMWMAIAGLGIATGATVISHADSTPANNPASDSDQEVWLVQQEAAIAKDPDAMGIMAFDRAADAIAAEPPDKQIEFFQKMLADTHSHAVQRHIRLKLADLFSKSNRDDNALEQLQQLITEPI